MAKRRLTVRHACGCVREYWEEVSCAEVAAVSEGALARHACSRECGEAMRRAVVAGPEVPGVRHKDGG